MAIDKQFYQSFETPYQPQTDTVIVISYPSNKAFQGDLGSILGEISLEAPSVEGVFFSEYVKESLVKSDEDFRLGIVSGQFHEAPTAAPDYLYVPPKPLPLLVELGTNKNIKLVYRDKKDKHQELNSAYQIGVYIDYLVVEVEGGKLSDIDPAVLKRMEADFLKAGAVFSEVDVDNYIKDPNYSFVPEKTSNSIPSLDSLLIQNYLK